MGLCGYGAMKSPPHTVTRCRLKVESSLLPGRSGRDGRAGAPSSNWFQARGPVPGTVEIAPEHEIGISAAVPGTDMEIGIRRGGNP